MKENKRTNGHDRSHYLQIYIAPKIVRTNLRRTSRQDCHDSAQSQRFSFDAYNYNAVDNMRDIGVLRQVMTRFGVLQKVQR